MKKPQEIMEIANIKIKQIGDSLEDVKGIDVNLNEGEKLKLEKIDIIQEARLMKNTTGLEFGVSGKQEAELKEIKIETPMWKLKILKGVTVNKQ